MRKADYCARWKLTRLACELHGTCPDAAACPDYQDAMEALALRRLHGAAAVSPTQRPQAKPVHGPACETPLRLLGHDAVCACPEHHTYRVRRSRRVCPRCGERLLTFGVPDPGWPLMYRLVYFICACGYVQRAGRQVGPNPNGPGRYGGQRWSPRTGRLLARKR